MTQARRRRSTRKPRRARGFDLTNLFLAIVAVLATLPWLFPMSFDSEPVARSAAEPVAAAIFTIATNHGAAR